MLVVGTGLFWFILCPQTVSISSGFFFLITGNSGAKDRNKFHNLDLSSYSFLLEFWNLINYSLHFIVFQSYTDYPLKTFYILHPQVTTSLYKEFLLLLGELRKVTGNTFRIKSS